MPFDDLTDQEWARINALFETHPLRGERRGRPRAHPRDVVNAVLWVLSTGASWSKLPARYPSPPTCRRRYEEWHGDGTLDLVVARLALSGRKIPAARRAPPMPQPTVVSSPLDRLRGAFWTNPESWRAPAKLA